MCREGAWTELTAGVTSWAEVRGEARDFVCVFQSRSLMSGPCWHLFAAQTAFLIMKISVIRDDKIAGKNLGRILRDNGLNEYNPYQWLMPGHGRRAQDNCYVKNIKEPDLPEEIRERQMRKVENVVPLSDEKLLLGFCDGMMRDDLDHYFVREILTTTEVCSMIGCSRQYLDELVRRKKLHPVKSEVRNRLFRRSEIAALVK